MSRCAPFSRRPTDEEAEVHPDRDAFLIAETRATATWINSPTPTSVFDDTSG
jgi:hypothetical protein